MIPQPQPGQQPPGAGAQMNGGAPMAPNTPPVDPAMLAGMEEMAKAVPWEDIVSVLKGGVSRQYRIDIETDSTVRGEIRQQQETIGIFLDGTAKFFESMFPIVQAGAMPPDVAVDLYTAFARVFRLGKQAEDALSRFGQAAQEAAKNPQPPAPDPEMIKAENEAKAREQEMMLQQQEARQRTIEVQQNMQMERDKHKSEMEARQQELAAMREEQQMEMAALQEKHRLEMAELQAKMMMEQQQAQFKAQTEREAADREFAHKERTDNLDFQNQQRQSAMEAQSQERSAKHEERNVHLKEYMAVQEHKRKMQQPAGQQRPKSKDKK